MLEIIIKKHDDYYLVHYYAMINSYLITQNTNKVVNFGENCRQSLCLRTDSI